VPNAQAAAVKIQGINRFLKIPSRSVPKEMPAGAEAVGFDASVKT
jgi:hypothetical protein